MTELLAVFNFTLQTRENINMADFIQKIDPNAPIPQSLEGGDGNGVLYECILDCSKYIMLARAFEESDSVKKYGYHLLVLQIEKNLYRPDYFVQWRFGESTTVGPKDPHAY